MEDILTDPDGEDGDCFVPKSTAIEGMSRAMVVTVFDRILTSASTRLEELRELHQLAEEAPELAHARSQLA